MNLFIIAKNSHPGGCELGSRPIDLHIKAMENLNATIVEAYGFITGKADKIIGAKIVFDLPSVGATENIMLAAAISEGETVVVNAAKEPEIVDLQNFLNKMGADIKGAGTDMIVINGVKKLHDAEYTIVPDRIVAGTYLVAAAITKGEIRLKNVVPSHLSPIISKLQEAGCTIKEEYDSVSLKSPKIIKPIKTVHTAPHPGFPNVNKG